MQKISDFDRYQSGGISLLTVIDTVKVIYLNLNTLSLIYLSSIGSTFYYLLLTFVIIEKVTIVLMNLNLSKQPTLVLILQVCLNILNFNKYSKIEMNSDLPFQVFQLNSVIFYDLLMVWYLFFSGQVYKISDTAILNILFLQLFVGFIYKTLYSFFLMIAVDKVRFRLISFFQCLSIFAGKVALQGLNLLLFQNSQFALFIIIWKSIVTYAESEIIIRKQLGFFGCTHTIKLQARMLCLILNLLNCPVDCAPFYDLKKIECNAIDFKQIEMMTQNSLIMVRVGQLVQTLLMFGLVQFNDEIGDGDSHVRYFYQFVKFCFVVNASLSLYHLMNKYIQAKTNNYTIFFAKEISLDKLKIILENSPGLRYFEVEHVIDIKKLQQNKFQVDTPEQVSERNKLFELFMNRAKRAHIKIGEQFVKDFKGVFLHGKYFADQFLDMIANQETLEKIRISDLDLLIQDNKQIFSRTILSRLFKFGHENNFQQFNQNLPIEFRIQCEKIVCNYLKDIFTQIAFYKFVSPCLNTNPKQVFYDLLE